MLKEKFDGAHEVKQKRKNGRRMLLPKYHKFGTHQDTDLVYLQTSPDYCEYDVKKGSLGTKGRECDPVSSERQNWNIPTFVLTIAFYRPPRESMVVTCSAVTGGTPPGGRGGRSDASVSSTGAATSSVRSA